jgi:hypothetical protein
MAWRLGGLKMSKKLILFRKKKKVSQLLKPERSQTFRDILSFWRHNIQHKDIQKNNTQHNDTNQNNTQHNDTNQKNMQHIDIQKSNTQHNDTNQNNTLYNDIQPTDNDPQH